ncbi:ABC transporter permease [Arthrobacter tumbae]|uniref:ABC transporter permease n=1 Tax=Arthrobacter tumbae TaxID=163874 RepID=UPI00195B1256|nr:ABC transporter permease [Arthrobacter tumbae]MBM7781866.1 ABC-2 type transport system permease protein [Arthrobacter tumbae]
MSSDRSVHVRRTITADNQSAPSSARIFRLAIRSGIQDFRQNYTVKSWTFGWLMRVLVEVLFFALIGVLLQDRETMLFLAVGRGLFLGVQEIMWTIQSSAWERNEGTLPLLVSAPGKVWPVFAGRSTQWFPSALTTSLIALFVLAPVLGVRYAGLQPVVVVIVGLVISVAGTYALALACASLVLRAPQYRNLASNLVHAVMALICGVHVPVEFWPTPIQWFAQTFPITHGLGAVRTALDSPVGSAIQVAVPGLLAAIAVSLAWFGLSVLLLERFASSARRNGSIDFDD